MSTLPTRCPPRGGLSTCTKTSSTGAAWPVVWTRGIDKIITLPVAHGEGKFIPRDASILRRLQKEGLIVLQYVEEHGRKAGYPYNPNGAVDDIAGICDTSGRIFGLMPHPERHIYAYQHPSWTRARKEGSGDGLAIFKNGVDFVYGMLVFRVLGKASKPLMTEAVKQVKEKIRKK